MKVALIDSKIKKELTTSAYQEVANFLINKSYLQIASSLFRFLEIEYYDLDDPYTHRDAKQYIPGCWYFHRKGGTYKGVDITCGHGSFLLRAIQDIQTEEVTEGPSLVVDVLLSKLDCPDVNTLRQKYIHPSRKNTNLKLVWQKQNTDNTILMARRVGLRELSEDPIRNEYYNKKLRFLISPALLKKGRKILIEDLKQEGMTKEEIINLVKCSPRSV